MIKRVWPIVLVDVTFQLLLAAIVLRSAGARTDHLRIKLPEAAATDGKLVQQGRPFCVELVAAGIRIDQQAVSEAEFAAAAKLAFDQGADQAVLVLTTDDIAAVRYVQAMALLRQAGFVSVATPCEQSPSKKE